MGPKIAPEADMAILFPNFFTCSVTPRMHTMTLLPERMMAHVTWLIIENSLFDVLLSHFRALLYGGMRESSQAEIELKDTPLNAFKHLLSYIYTGTMTLANLRDDLILEILGLAHQYGFQVIL